MGNERLKLEVEEILRRHPRLTADGYGRCTGCSPNRLKEQASRAELLTPESVGKIGRLCEWMRENLGQGINVNNSLTSYTMKPLAERAVGYVSNGQFIVAALLCGYKMSGRPKFSPSFNFRLGVR